MSEDTIVVTDEDGTEYEVDPDALEEPKIRLAFIDNEGAEKTAPINGDFEVTEKTKRGGKYGPFKVIGPDLEYKYDLGWDFERVEIRKP